MLRELILIFFIICRIDIIKVFKRDVDLSFKVYELNFTHRIKIHFFTAFFLSTYHSAVTVKIYTNVSY